MNSDGTEYDHSLKNERGQPRKATGYDEVWNTLARAGLRMVGDHGYQGQTYSIELPIGVDVGTVSFDNNNGFVGGKLYDQAFIAGRVVTARAALSEFILEVEKIHG